jgi:hypothetical protein
MTNQEQKFDPPEPLAHSLEPVTAPNRQAIFIVITALELKCKLPDLKQVDDQRIQDERAWRSQLVR